VDERILAHPANATRTPTEGEARLAKLEERLAHELMDDEERLELRERIVCLRRRLGL
jgi:hypothetical protein